MDVAVGGTFDPLHEGHRDLLRRAFELGEVTVGLTSDELASEMRPHGRHVRPFEDRERELQDELRGFAEHHGRSFEVRRLDSPTGIATEPPFEALVVSPETEAGGDRINEIRREGGLAPLRIEVVPHRRAEDGEIISSTRIVRGEIDEHGNLTPDAEARVADGAKY